MKEVLYVLLVEDNEDDIEILNEYFDEIENEHNVIFDYSFNITIKENIKDALDYLAGTPKVDVVLLDLSLPDSRGLEGFYKFSQYVFDIPFIITTGIDDGMLSAKALRKGAQDYVVKGKISADILARTIRHSIERHRMMSMLRNLSLIDELTGLYNRRGMTTIVEQMKRQAIRDGKKIAVVFADIDKMKEINDRYGHQAGDMAIIFTSDILKRSFRDADLTARIGGDEFVTFAMVGDDYSEDMIHSRIRENVKKHNIQSSVQYSLSISVGVQIYEVTEELFVDEIISHADEIMYKQKQSLSD